MGQWGKSAICVLEMYGNASSLKGISLKMGNPTMQKRIHCIPVAIKATKSRDEWDF